MFIISIGAAIILRSLSILKYLYIPHLTSGIRNPNEIYMGHHNFRLFLIFFLFIDS